MKTVNDIGEQESQPEGIEFSDLNGRITLQDFADNDDDDDSNASDEDFKLDDEYNDEVADEIALEEEDESVGNDDPDSQEDYFQNPIQQHNNDVVNNNEPISEIIPGNNRRNALPVLTLSNSVTPAIQECGKRNKRNKVRINDQDTMIEDELDDDLTTNNNDKPIAKPNVDDEGNENDIDVDTPKELESDLGSYWALAQSAEAYVLNTIASYNNIEASKSAP
jgi:hypothetical protein